MYYLNILPTVTANWIYSALLHQFVSSWDETRVKFQLTTKNLKLKTKNSQLLLTLVL